MNNIEQQIQALRQKYNNDVIEKGKSEGRLEELQKKKDEVIAKCTAKGIKPEEISTKKQEAQSKLESLLGQANRLCGFDEQSQQNYVPSNNAPF